MTTEPTDLDLDQIIELLERLADSDDGCTLSNAEVCKLVAHLAELSTVGPERPDPWAAAVEMPDAAGWWWYLQTPLDARYAECVYVTPWWSVESRERSTCGLTEMKPGRWLRAAPPEGK